MKNIKEMIIPILLGFTLVISIYNTIQINFHSSISASRSDNIRKDVERLTENQQRIRQGLVTLLK